MISSQKYIVIVMLLTSNYPAFSSADYLYSFSYESICTHINYSCLISNTDSPKYQIRSSVDKSGVNDDELNDVALKHKKYKKGDTLYYCDVLKLSNQDYGGHMFAVFGYSHIKERKGRSKIRIKYILNRERNYLSKIFYSRAVKIERNRVDISVKKYMKQLEKKYPKVRMWGVLDANAIL